MQITDAKKPAFKPKVTMDQTTAAARAIIDEETAARHAKVARLRALRVARDQQPEAPSQPAKPRTRRK